MSDNYSWCQSCRAVVVNSQHCHKCGGTAILICVEVELVKQAKCITELESENKAVLRRAESAEEDLKIEESKTTELEAKIQSAKDIVSSQGFWCELADQECIGLKSIVHLVEQALKGK